MNGPGSGQWYYGYGSETAPLVAWVPEQEMALERWTHVACVRKLGDKGLIYVNGVLVGKKRWNSFEAASSEAAIIVMADPESNSYQDGKMRDLRIWNMARSAGAIEANMNKTLDGNEEGLVGYWRFDEGRGNIAIDSAGKNHGLIYNATWSN